MTDDQKDLIYGRLSREVKGLKDDLARLEVELARIGTNFEVAGRILKRHDVPIVLDKKSADLDVAQVFDLIAKYNQASAELTEKQAALDKLGI